MYWDLLTSWLFLSAGVTTWDYFNGHLSETLGKIYWMGVAFAWVAYKARRIRHRIE